MTAREVMLKSLKFDQTFLYKDLKNTGDGTAIVGDRILCEDESIPFTSFPP